MSIYPNVPWRVRPVWPLLVTLALMTVGCASAGRSAARSAAAGDWDDGSGSVERREILGEYVERLLMGLGDVDRAALARGGVSQESGACDKAFCGACGPRGNDDRFRSRPERREF